MRALLVVAALVATAGAVEAGLRAVNVRSLAPGVPPWVVALALAFGAVVGGGFVAAQGAVRSRTSGRSEAGGYGSPRALGAETGAFVTDEAAYKGALLRKLGAAPTPPFEPARARSRYAPCPHCATPMRFAPGEESAKCTRCGRTSRLPGTDDDAT